MKEQYASLITGFPLFSGLTTHGAQMLLDGGQLKNYKPQEMLFKEGDSADFTFVVLTGKLQVFLTRGGSDVTLLEAGPGTILGELAVMCRIPRSASVRATEDSVLLQWSADQFRSMLVQNKLFSERVLGQTLRTLIEKERSLVEALAASQTAPGPGK
jgi:CRP-like cAMP-binding protein